MLRTQMHSIKSEEKNGLVVKADWPWGISSVVEFLLSLHEMLSAIPGITKIRKDTEASAIRSQGN